MAKLPKMPYGSAIRKNTHVQFGGLRHSRNCGDGEFYDMMNLSVEDYPVAGIRRMRGKRGGTVTDYVKLYADNGFFLTIDREGRVWYWRATGGTRYQLYRVEEPEKTEIVRFGDRAVLMPDGVLLKIKYPIMGIRGGPDEQEAQPGEAWLRDVQEHEGADPIYEVDVYNGESWDELGTVFEFIRQGVTVDRIIIRDGEIYGEAAKANTVQVPGTMLNRGLHVGDAVFFEGLTRIKGNNKSAIIREINGDTLVFDEYCFDMPEEDDEPLTEYAETGTIVIERKSPKLDFVFEHQNRLWGAEGKTMMCSKLGDPLNWYVLGDGQVTDGWQLETQTPGKLTGGISYGGYPTFFKQDRRYIVYGSSPANFQTFEILMPGVAEGKHRTLGVAGGSLFYCGERTMHRYYSEGYPDSLEDVIGTVEESGMSASNGTHYFVQLKVDGEWALYHYDGRRGLWTRESDTGMIGMSYMDGNIYALDRRGDMWELLGQKIFKQIEDDEDTGLNFAEFGDFTFGYADRKAVTKLELRMQLEEYTSVVVSIRYDDGEWVQIAQLSGENGPLNDERKRSVYLPIIPHRCDHYRIKLEGTGRWWLYSLAIEQRFGSPMHYAP